VENPYLWPYENKDLLRINKAKIRNYLAAMFGGISHIENQQNPLKGL
jgi:hypothetical protein